MRLRHAAVAASLLSLACSSTGTDGDDGKQDLIPNRNDCLTERFGDFDEIEREVTQTLMDLAAFGEKRSGLPGGIAAGDYVKQRLADAGIPEVRFESYSFPSHEVKSSRLEISQDPLGIDAEFVVFEASGSGSVIDADVVWVEDATDDAIEDALQREGLTDLSGKIALLERNSKFHRSAQYGNLIRNKAAAMLYISAAEDRMIQTGSVRETWEAQGPIPAVSIDAERGQAVVELIEDGAQLTATIEVDAEIVERTGRNVVGVIKGKKPGQIVLGGHYDTWHVGSIDNGAGIAALLAIAEEWGARLRAGQTPEYDLVFAAFDGEELALYGGYDYLRKHQAEHADNPIIAVYNFEVPSAIDQSLRKGMAGSWHPFLNEILEHNCVARFIDGEIGGSFDLCFVLGVAYEIFVSLDFVNEQFGIIATDIQGFYRSGFYTASTAVDSKWYHTVEDTPDKVDTAFLGNVADQFSCVVDEVNGEDLEDLSGFDENLWRSELIVTPTNSEIIVDVELRDADGRAPQDAWLTVTVFCSDFFRVAEQSVAVSSSGNATVRFPDVLVDEENLEYPVELADCSRGRFVQITAGPHEDGLRSHARTEIACDINDVGDAVTCGSQGKLQFH